MRIPEPTHVSQLRAMGLSERERRRAVAPLTRVAPGAYADLTGLSSEGIHLVRTRAVLDRLADVVASHTSAAVAWGLPVMDRHLDMVHVSRTDARPGRPSSSSAFTMHSATVPAARIAEPMGLPATDALATVLGTATVVEPDWGVAVGDAALHAGLVSPGQLAHAAAQVRRVHGAQRARRLADHCSPLAESPGESLLRLRLVRFGLQPVEQVRLRSVPGDPRVDFLIAGRLVIEFDGRAKYEIGDVSQAHWQEKLRHDRLLEAGYVVLRVTWAQLWDEAELRRRILGALSRC